MARPKVLGNYAKLSASYYRDDAILEAGERAELLYVRGLAYNSESMSDGFISDRQLVAVVGIGMRDVTKRASLLVRLGLWQRVEGGYVVRTWLKWNKSAEEIGAALRRDRQRKSHHDPDGTEPDSERIPDGIQADSDSLYKASQASTSLSAPTERPTPPASAQRPAGQPELDGMPPEPEATWNGGRVVKEWIDACRHRPPGRTVGQISDQVGKLLGEGFEVDVVREALRRWQAAQAKNAKHASLLPDFVHEVLNAPRSADAPTTAQPSSGWAFMRNPSAKDVA